MAHIKLHNVCLEYPVYGTNSRSLKNSVLNLATGGLLNKNKKTVTVEALKMINFDLQKGDRLGLIGHNGAGKSTLLKVLAQIYEPTNGNVEVVGQTSCLFDMMLGLDASLTGYENIMLRGLILGFTKKEISKNIPEIVEFAELGEFIQMPLKSYSSGMLLRLAFGIITSCYSEILLIDEIVNVGDARFMKKAKERLTHLINHSGILVLSTHDHQLIKEFCNKVLYLENGEMKYFGEVNSFFNQL